ncbi:alanine racemase [Corynebacterium sp. HMSC074C01]|uniref:alanine racemase n=1 Tax=unclassified Corynebacterium TaxID=2624378 RepID=UPI0008A30B94|nr:MULTISPECIES: alanine racemase [unclassified Corynebacterium]OFP62891.1 alanine racemase [Corynebacterium sp. HMSC074C01]OHO62332.1 alanine racemase [Corynebacterium sp. HMSC036D02]
MPILVTTPQAQVRAAVEPLVRSGESPAPVGVIDLAAFDYNAAQMPTRAGGLPIRVASKSIRSVAALRRALEHEGYRGILAYSVPEALHLVGEGFRDIVVAYPSVNRKALRELAADDTACEAITIMVDSAELLDLLEGSLRVAIDIDCTLHLPGAVIGPRRSPVRTPEQVSALAHEILRRGHRLVGLMAYEGQVASVADGLPGPVGAVKRWLRSKSMADLAPRRRACVAAAREVADIEFVNGGGTGSLQESAAEGTLTELAAGSGFYTPAIFDDFTGINHKAAAFFVCQVSRVPAPGWATVNSGGWIASGPPAKDRVPVPVWPAGLSYSSTEGAGEVQTPLRGADLSVEDLVWFRHAKAGEMTENVDRLLAVGHDGVDVWDTYRGQGWTLR